MLITNVSVILFQQQNASKDLGQIENAVSLLGHITESFINIKKWNVNEEVYEDEDDDDDDDYEEDDEEEEKENVNIIH